MCLRRTTLRASCICLLGSALGLSGCSNEPSIPADVQEAVRRREQEEERAHEELVRERERMQKASGQAADSPSEPTADTPSDDHASDPSNGVAPPEASADAAANDTDPPRDDSPPITKSVEPPPKPTAPVPPRDQATLQKWSQMKAGMTPDEVLKLLGKPTRQGQDFFLTYWYYGTGQSAGKVAFITQSQRTMAWDQPLR